MIKKMSRRFGMRVWKVARLTISKDSSEFTNNPVTVRRRGRMTTDNIGSSEKPGTVSQYYLLPSLSNNPGATATQPPRPISQPSFPEAGGATKLTR